MSIPSLINYDNVNDYENHFIREYCHSPIITFDSIPITFRRSSFYHAFFKSSGPDRIKNKFSKSRAQKIDWIKASLQCPKAELYQGWVKGNIDPLRRVSITYGNYIVVVKMRLRGDGVLVGDFITAYTADLGPSLKIKLNPKWKMPIKKDR